jgi:hypothetical protein
VPSPGSVSGRAAGSRAPAAITDTGNPGRDAERALRTMLERGLAPHGLRIFLNAAHVAEADLRSVVLEVPAGPGLERLAGESSARAAMQQVMSELLGRAVELSVRSTAVPVGRGAGGAGVAGGSAAAGTPSRITPERVRSDRLSRLAAQGEGLKQAVESWDLELLD